MNKNLDSIRKKIEALLAQASDTSVGEAEADAFNRKAHELMLKYNIQRSDLGDDAVVDRGHLTLEVQIRPWSTAVLAGISSIYYCDFYSEPLDYKGRKHKVTIIGEKHNVMVCHAIAMMVLRSIQTEARATKGGRSFMTGAGYRVHERCQEMMDYAERAPQVEDSSSSQNTLVVLREDEQEGNSAYIEDTLGVKLVKRRSSGAQVNNADAYSQGRAHGGKVQLRRNLLS